MASQLEKLEDKKDDLENCIRKSKRKGKEDEVAKYTTELKELTPQISKTRAHLRVTLEFRRKTCKTDYEQAVKDGM